MTKHNDFTRRAALTGATAPAVGASANIAAIVVTKADADPILEVIERHRSTYMEWLDILCAQAQLEDELPDHRRKTRGWAREPEDFVETDDPRWIANIKAYHETWDRNDAAAVDMTNVRPTTMAGVMALLDYIDRFNLGQLRRTDRKNCGSEHHQWPEDLEDEAVTTPYFGGRALDMPWPFWVMRNIQAALQSIAVMS